MWDESVHPVISAAQADPITIKLVEIGLDKESPQASLLYFDMGQWGKNSDDEANMAYKQARDVVPEFCRKLSPAGGFWRKFLIPAPAPSPAARSRIPGGIPSGLQELQEWRSSCY
ncbi:hypothetical protein RhiJN_10688 [Ceratobasidium sp. AG-Ba]|nr:hypothetical protein RhiJN_10688 [Ceratobasidium sp. AG-Ba]QRW11422.1 hypothetical protein RhiLY_10421 [Ceratobasidium sp. AG-Ba]